MAIKTNVKVSYFQDAADLCLFLTKEGRLEQGKFLEMWRGGLQEHRVEVSGFAEAPVESVMPRFEAASVFFVARTKRDPQNDLVYVSCKSFNNIVLLAEVGFRPGTGTASITVKSPQPQYVPLLATSIEKLLKA